MDTMCLALIAVLSSLSVLQDKVTGTEDEKAAAAKRFAEINNGELNVQDQKRLQ